MPEPTSVLIRVPSGARFANLKLSRNTSGDISFDWSPIEQLCATSGLDVAMFKNSDESNVAGLIVAWYAEARARGEPPDLVAEDLFAEVRAEDALGFGISHKPGSA